MKQINLPDRPWMDIGWASSVGLVMVLCTVIGLAIGIGLDRWLNTHPWLTLLFLILGIVSGFWNILKDVLVKGKRKE
jgi:ATP synthase protein I